MGVAASLLFSVTFIVNRVMSVGGGSWVWSSSLRFYWMIPFFVAIVWYQGGLKQLLAEIRANFTQWLIWSTVGFGLFYAPLTYAAAYTPSWLLAGTWQFTIIAGMLLAPFITRNKSKQPSNLRSSAIFSGIILLGIIIMQMEHAEQLSFTVALKGVVPVLVAAFAYPLGNRKMMQVTAGRLNVYQRILGMVVCSVPFWILINIYGLVVEQTLPSTGQYFQTLVVAVFSGIFATALFFRATESAHGDEKQLAAVEATQSTEVLFALAGEIFILNSPLPDFYAIIGMGLVMVGMVLHSVRS